MDGFLDAHSQGRQRSILHASSFMMSERILLPTFVCNTHSLVPSPQSYRGLASSLSRLIVDTGASRAMIRD